MVQYNVIFSNSQEHIFYAPTRAELSNQYKQYAEKHNTKVISVQAIQCQQTAYKLIPTNTILTADELYKLYILSYPNREETFTHFILERTDTISAITE
jgi:hypothetical protein